MTYFKYTFIFPEVKYPFNFVTAFTFSHTIVNHGAQLHIS